MDIHYNAFISYRHHPDDIKVAEQIHRGLEHFKIPRSIRKRKNISSVRLFRDKEELPITSSLTTDISHALENSDYLIVICSEHTRESVWVQREIETFLQTHTRDQILTVLAGGEPYDVLPEILLYEDVVNPVTGNVERHEYEPLSCDWRLKKRKAVREELPRLAATLLGCGYDELRQRQRRYKTQRLVALFSLLLLASLALTAYFIQTGIKVQKALDQALTNQSEYLASVASEKLTSGDRMSAISLAMTALPSKGNERPYVPKAELALSRSLHSYVSTGSILAHGAFLADSPVNDFAVSDDESHLAMLDNRDFLTLWDTETFRKLATIDLSSRIVEQLQFTPSGKLLVILFDAVFCYEPDGTRIWVAANCNDTTLLDGGEKLLVVQTKEYYDEYYAVLDTDTGETLSTFTSVLPSDPDSTHDSFLLQEQPSDRPVPVLYSNSDIYFLALLDLQTGTMQELLQWDYNTLGYDYIQYAAWDAKENLILICNDRDGRASKDLFCYDPQTLALRWQARYELEYHLYDRHYAIEPVPGSDTLLIQIDDYFQFQDSLSGELLSNYHLDSTPLTVTAEETLACGVTDDGKYYLFYYNEGSWPIPFAEGTLSKAIEHTNGLYVHTPLSSQVTLYRVMSDTQVTAYDKTNVSLYTDFLMDGNYILGRDMDDETASLVDVSQKKTLWQQDFNYEWTPLGFSEDGSRLWMANEFSGEIVEHSTTDGTRKDLAVTDSMQCCLLTGEKVLFITFGGELKQIDLQTGKEELLLKLPMLDTSWDFDMALIFATEDYAWLWFDKDVYVIDLQTGKDQVILSKTGAKPTCTWNEDNDKLLITADSELLLARSDGEILQRIDLGHKKAISSFLYGKQILVLCDNGTICRYDRNGSLLSEIPLTVDSLFYSDTSFYGPDGIFWWPTDDGDLIVRTYSNGHIIDCKNWGCKAYIPKFYAYAAQTDEIICVEDGQLYAHPRYTTEQQIIRGQQILGDFRLTEEQLRYYGLD